MFNPYTVADCTNSGETTLLPVVIPDVMLDANYASQAAEASPVPALDIATFNSTYPISVADPSFFEATTYAGAIDPSATEMWYEGWIIQGSL